MTLDDLINKSEVAKLVAKVSGHAESYVYDRIMRRPDFPRPTRRIGRSAIYAKPDVEKWLGVK